MNERTVINYLCRLTGCLLLFFSTLGCGGDEPQHDKMVPTEDSSESRQETVSPISVSKIMDISDLYDNSYIQSMAIYGDYAFVLNTKGGCRVVDLNQKQVIAETRLATYVSDNHANHAEFSHQFKDQSSFPLLYVTPLYSGRCYVENYHSETNTFSREQTILLSTTVFSNERTTQFSIDRDKGLLYVISHKGLSEEHLRWFKLPDINKKWVTLTDDDLLGSHILTKIWNNSGQGSYIIKGNLYLMYGTDKTEHDIYVVDLNTFNYKHYEFSQFLSAEPEGLAPYKGYLMVNTNFPGGIYRLMKY